MNDDNPEKAPPGQPRKPKIGDSMPAPPGTATQSGSGGGGSRSRRRRRRGGGGASGNQDSGQQKADQQDSPKKASGDKASEKQGQGKSGGRNRNRRRRKGPAPVEVSASDFEAVELDEEELQRRRGAYKDGKALGRYQMMVHVAGDATHIAVLEGRSLVEHYVARPSDDVLQIHGNIYVGRVENVLPGMEAAFVDIATPKNAVLYRADITWDPEEIEGVKKGEKPRIEQVLEDRQMVLCQVTKNPIAHKGARLTQEVSIPGRFVVFVPNSNTIGISKRLSDQERKRLRKILDKARPAGPRADSPDRGRGSHRRGDPARRAPSGRAVGRDLQDGHRGRTHPG